MNDKRNTAETIYICSNHETLADGCFDWDNLDEIEWELDEIIKAGEDMIEDDARVTCELDSNFQNWHGGKRKNNVGITIKGVTYGYAGCWVMTHAQNPPQWLRDLCDRAQEAMVAKALELSADLQM